MPGKKIIEVRVKGFDKGLIVKKVVHDNEYDFILACGDDNTDEDMFKEVSNSEQASTIKIGDTASYAQYNLYTPQMMASLLDYLANASIL